MPAFDNIEVTGQFEAIDSGVGFMTLPVVIKSDVIDLSGATGVTYTYFNAIDLSVPSSRSWIITGAWLRCIITNLGGATSYDFSLGGNATTYNDLINQVNMTVTKSSPGVIFGTNSEQWGSALFNSSTSAARSGLLSNNGDSAGASGIYSGTSDSATDIGTTGLLKIGIRPNGSPPSGHAGSVIAYLSAIPIF